MEAALVERAKIPYRSIPAAGLHGVGLTHLPGNAWKLTQGWMAARDIISAYQPDVLFFTGGYVTVPVAYAGRGIRKVCYVPDIEPALAMKLISRQADLIAVTTEESQKYYPASTNVTVDGYPTRFDPDAMDMASAYKTFNLNRELPVVLVFGGSRGARSINQALWSVLPETLGIAQVIHITGELDWPSAASHQAKLNENQTRNYHPFPYLHEEMGYAFAAADLVVSRAGAAVLGEYPLFGLPAVLIPYPHAWRYQKTNAAYLETKGAAVVLADEHIGETLLPTVSNLLKDQARLDEMRSASRSLARPDAAKRIAKQLWEFDVNSGVDLG